MVPVVEIKLLSISKRRENLLSMLNLKSSKVPAVHTARSLIGYK